MDYVDNPHRATKLTRKLLQASGLPETWEPKVMRTIFAALLALIEVQIEEARRIAGQALARKVDQYAHGVFVGQAQPLEDHTAQLAHAFAPARATLRAMYGDRVRMYRAEPKRPPKIKREFLSWSTRKSLASQFLEPSAHIVAADVDVEDVVFGITSPVNRGYIEFLVRDRPHYHVALRNA